MNVWIVNPYGTLPSEGWREYRSSMLARALAERGHTVTWWISNFEHRSKTFRPAGHLIDPNLPDRVNVIAVESSSYRRNISFARVKYEYVFGNNFKKVALATDAPDSIVLADPSLFYSKPVLDYAKKVDSKVVLDVLDLWPEQFHIVLPKLLKPLGRFIFAPLYRRRKKLINTVDAVAAVTKDHLRSISLPKGKKGIVVYLGIDFKNFLIDSARPTPPNVASFVKNAELVVVYAGTLGEAYDFDTLLFVVRKIAIKSDGIKFIFAGSGPYVQSVKVLASSFPNSVLFLGNVPASDLPSIYKICDVGICSYSKESTVTMPVKLYDYLAANLYIIYSINGEIDDLLGSTSNGKRYAPGSAEDLSAAIMNIRNRKVCDSFGGNNIEIAKSFDSRLQHSKFAIWLECLTNET